MRVLFTLLPATGSLQPLLPVAASLQERGHEVAFVSSATMAADMEERGFAFFPAGLDWHASNPDYVQTLCLAAGGLSFPVLVGSERFRWVTDNLFIGGAARQLLPDLLRIVLDWCPNLIVRESLEFAGCVAAEKLGIAHASVAAGADCALDKREDLASPLAALRHDAGLPVDTDRGMPYRYLHLCFAPPSFHGPDARFPSTARFFQHEITRRPGGHQAVESAPGARPTVLVSLGTVFHRTPGLIETIVEALRSEPIELQVAVGFDQDPSRLGSQPANVHIKSWLPVDQVLRNSALFITHGGFNSVTEALTIGVPMVVIPIAGDQPYSARQCSALGVAEVVNPDERTPERIRAAARSVLGDRRYEAKASGVRDEIAALPLASGATTMLEDLAAATGGGVPGAV